MWVKENRAVELYLKGEELLQWPRIDVKFAGIVTNTHVLGEYGWRLCMKQRTPLHVPRTRPYVALSPDEKWDFGFRFRLRARAPYRNEREVFDDMMMFSSSVVKFSMSKFETKEIPVYDKEMTESLQRKVDQLQIQKQDLQAEVHLLETQNRNLEKVLEAEALRDLKDERKDADRMVDVGALVEMRAEIQLLARDNAALRSKLDFAELDRARESDPFELLARWNREHISRLDFSTSAAEPPHEPASNVVDLVEILRQRESVDMDHDLEERMMTILGTA